MKISRMLMLLVVMLTAFSCSKDESDPTPANYESLGITSITINDQKFAIEKGSMLVVDKASNISLTGTTSNLATKHSELEYAIFTTKGTIPFVKVESNQDGVSINVSSKTLDNGLVRITAIISRNGYQEELTYNFTFSAIL